MSKSAFILPAVAVAGVVGMLSIFIVDERESALVLQFSKIIDVKEEPGLGFKIPFIQQVVRYDDRILSRDIDPLEVTPLDDRRLVVDAFARYRIVDVRRFREAVGDGGIPFAESRLDSILRSRTREVLGSVSSNDILSTDRAALMLRIRNAAISEARELGIEVVDVRLKRTDLPAQNLDATFARMRAEREREAADEIARGNEAAQRVRAQADRTQVELVSDARRQAEITRGEADALSNAIFNEAFGADAEFFEFYRSLDAYRAALQGSNSSIVMSPDSDFFSYFNSVGGPVPPLGAAGQAAAAEAAQAVTAGSSSGAEAEPETDAGTDGADVGTGGDAASGASTSGVLSNGGTAGDDQPAAE
ncbi:protease FtsH subunit HflC [Roseovarius nanhaiticus]|uniref:Protease FtsH subunit HflC n=1 Tax=Roseovarius nanhaiticus TaxID=573024 RepID=A0A1N7GVE7_9RHOB|nr:protease modulator HflC [Roseovarius nanhaiticus]SEL31674.1 protease FtsH subunit HflC [Roseovarius nanhaiticus]SIS16539.1 protease FtsH subunit HflC [Roseovarius nanhaiticus]